ncbi:MAG: hemerythrin family protein [Arenicellales bacterium]|nr:hemerythrin family protein [Arenicellales bacterium]
MSQSLIPLTGAALLGFLHAGPPSLLLSVADGCNKTAPGHKMDGGYPRGSELTAIDDDKATINNEHELQLKLLRAIESGVAQQATKKDLAALVEQLSEYTNVHFLSEQLLMRMYEYPAYQEHKQHHDELVTQIKALQQRLGSGNGDETASLVATLRDWLTGHIERDDAAFTRYLEQHIQSNS